MNDRTLLERAAKAAGMTGYRSHADGLHRMLDPARPDSTGTVGKAWNPLTDDGDALRLAVNLRLRVEHDGSCATVYLPTGQRYCWTEAAVVEGNDPYAATRRAIVRAAAALSEGVAA